MPIAQPSSSENKPVERLGRFSDDQAGRPTWSNGGEPRLWGTPLQPFPALSRPKYPQPYDQHSAVDNVVGEAKQGNATVLICRGVVQLPCLAPTS
jgi:hypothetical protein